MLEKAYQDIIGELPDRPAIIINSSPVDISTIEVKNFCPESRPIYSEAYASYAEFENGIVLTEAELEELDQTEIFHEYVIQIASDYVSPESS